MDQGTIATLVQLSYVLAAALFIVGLHRMSSPATARNGNIVSAFGMALAVLATAVGLALGVDVLGGVTPGGVGWGIIAIGTIIGGGVGFYLARTVQMTAMPQMVSLFNAAGGGAAALVAIDEFIKFSHGADELPLHVMIATLLGVAFGALTFTGSLVAFGKLQGLVPGRPVTFPASQFVNLGLFLVLILGAGYLIVTGDLNVPVLLLLTAVALALGVTTTMPIGGADMPVVISLLNAFTGTAAAMAGFVINNPALIISGALVGAAGTILTQLMARAMNRSLGNILFGAFGTGDTAAGAEGAYAGGGSAREIGEDDAAILLAYARSVIVVPGYGLAVAQAQRAVADLAAELEKRGVEVLYAIHPVAGRMPGHMNVLLAEANVPYPQLIEMDEINPEFPRTDVALVVGANDVTNPAARSNPASPIFGMPILDVDAAQNIIVIKRSMRPGFAGIDNELYVNPKTGMLFGDAKEALGRLVNAVKAV